MSAEWAEIMPLYLSSEGKLTQAVEKGSQSVVLLEPVTWTQSLGCPSLIPTIP